MISSKFIIFQSSDGGIRRALPVIKEGETEVEALDRYEAELRSKGIITDEVRVADVLIEDGGVPVEAFKDALTFKNGKVDIDMPKARSISKNNIRASRQSKLEDLDVQYMKADEANDTASKNEITAKKTIARDAPDNKKLEDATTATELKTVMESIQAEIQAM